MEEKTNMQNEELVFSAEECEKIKPVIEDFVDSYAEAKRADMPVRDWLIGKMRKELPDRSEQDIVAMSDEILDTLHVAEEKQKSLSEAVKNGRSKESWFANELKTATSAMSVQETVKFMNELGTALEKANGEMINTIATKSGAISMNPNLDGFIAEQFHAQTFNLNSIASGKSVYAEVLQPEGAYNANGVDVVIKDHGVIKHRYQLKYGSTAEDTIRLVNEGNYRGQQLVVPEGQVEEVQKAFPNRKVSGSISCDGISSRPLTKDEAKALRDEAQSGQFKEWNWEKYAYKDIAVGMGKQVAAASLMGAAIGAGMDVATKLYKGEEVKFKDVAAVAVESGLDFGVKSAITGAIKVGAEKGLIRFVAKGTPAGRIANVVFVGVENAKIMYKIATGKIPAEEGLNRMEEVTISTAGGLLAMTKGASLGAAWGTVFGPIGTAVGGFVGGTVGYMAGSAVGKKVAEGSRIVREKVTPIIKNMAQKVSETAGRIGTNIKSGIQSVGRAVSKYFSGPRTFGPVVLRSAASGLGFLKGRSKN